MALRIFFGCVDSVLRPVQAVSAVAVSNGCRCRGLSDSEDVICIVRACERLQFIGIDRYVILCRVELVLSVRRSLCFHVPVIVAEFETLDRIAVEMVSCFCDDHVSDLCIHCRVMCIAPVERIYCACQVCRLVHDGCDLLNTDRTLLGRIGDLDGKHFGHISRCQRESAHVFICRNVHVPAGTDFLIIVGSERKDLGIRVTAELSVFDCCACCYKLAYRVLVCLAVFFCPVNTYSRIFQAVIVVVCDIFRRNFPDSYFAVFLCPFVGNAVHCDTALSYGFIRSRGGRDNADRKSCGTVILVAVRFYRHDTECGITYDDAVQRSAVQLGIICSRERNALL